MVSTTLSQGRGEFWGSTNFQFCVWKTANVPTNSETLIVRIDYGQGAVSAEYPASRIIRSKENSARIVARLNRFIAEDMCIFLWVILLPRKASLSFEWLCYQLEQVIKNWKIKLIIFMFCKYRDIVKQRGRIEKRNEKNEDQAKS